MTDGGDEASHQGTLAVARRRFAESLPRKAAELRAGLALLAATPDGARPQKEMRRRVHALLASSQVFRLEGLEEALRDAVHLLDTARSLGRALDQDELDQLANLCATLPRLVHPSGAPLTDPPSPFAPSPTSRRASAAPAGSRSAGPPAPAAPPSYAAPPSRDSALPAATRPRSSGTLRMGAVARPGASAEGVPLRVPSGSFTAVTRGSQPPPASGALRAAPTVVSVLVVDGVETQSSVRAMLAVESFEVMGAADPEEALRVARSTAPDVVLADRAIVHRPGVDLVGRLRSDPLTDFVPIVLLLPPGAPNDPVAVREIGADDAIERPIDPEVLRTTIVRVVSTTQGAATAPDTLPDLTLDEIADRVAGEVRRGIVAAAEQGADLTIPLGGGGEVLAATWAAVARIRSFVARRTSGRVRFRDPPGRGPALLALVAGGDDQLPDPTAGEVVLEGRRALVVDDDPSIVWFFAGLLRGAGMTVFECFDGRDALVAARRERPELVVTDIVMPGLDGLGLLRELRRDLLLSDVPVIVLSWKEDFLQRLRELGAPADAYLRKEVGVAETLLRVKEVLRPRARVEAALRRDSDVRGRLERLGFAALVETVARQWPDARVVVRDAAHLFELDLRDGAPADVTRTAIDGTFSRGPSAFLNLVGLRSGRFTIQRATSPVRATLHGSLDELLRDAAERIGACIDAVSGNAVVKASRVRIDDGAADAIERTSPEPMRSLISRLRDGESPRDLVTSGEIGAAVLETCLVDLARRGAILAVRGLDGEDRLAHMIEARRNPAPRESARPPRAESEPPQPLRLSDPEIRAVVLSDVAERISTPPPMPADAPRGSVAHAPSLEPSPPIHRESRQPAPRPTDPPILRLSDPEVLRADDTPRVPGQRRTLELVGDDSALAAAVAALVAPAPDGSPPPRTSRVSLPTTEPRPASERAPSSPRPDAPSVSSIADAGADASSATLPADPFELDEAFRPAVIPVPVLPLSTATARASKSEPPLTSGASSAVISDADILSLDDSDELSALVADLRASMEPAPKAPAARSTSPLAPSPTSSSRPSASATSPTASSPPSASASSPPSASATSPTASSPPSASASSPPSASATHTGSSSSPPSASASSPPSASATLTHSSSSAPPSPTTSSPPTPSITAAPIRSSTPASAPATPPTATPPSSADVAPSPRVSDAPKSSEKPARRDPSEPDIEIAPIESSRRSSSAPRPDSGRPSVDAALPSVIVSKELEPIVTNISAGKAARMGLVPGSAPPSSGGLFVLVLILVGLALIVALGWSMAKPRTPEPGAVPESYGALDPSAPGAVPGTYGAPEPSAAPSAVAASPSTPRAFVERRDAYAPPAAGSATLPSSPVAVSVRPPAPSVLGEPPNAVPRSGVATGRLRLLLPDGPDRRPLPYEILLDGRRLHRSDVVSSRDLELERDVAAGLHELRVRRAGNVGYRAIYVPEGRLAEVDLRR